jgi:4-hydroxybenzoate polyprenyltransferase/phosphoserine phosphatase
MDMDELHSTPLVVDLDGTLSSSDSLLEALLFLALRKPKLLPRSLSAMMEGKAALKERVASVGGYQNDTLPLRGEFVEFLRSERARGRRMYLVTAADQSVADAIADRVGLFEKAIGSSDGVNLKSSAKRARLEELLPGGYSYAGNDYADLDVWRAAKSIVIVGASPSVSEQARALGLPVEREFVQQRAGWKAWARALRVHQWAKNILMFVPLFLAGKFYDPYSVLMVTLGFVAFGAVASSTYLINDLSDLAADRRHTTKKNRPIARGEISISSALSVAALLGGCGLIAVFLIDDRFGLIALLYVALTLSYSIRLKAIALLDVFILSLLYTTRVEMGSVILSSDVSAWLIIFSLFFFYSLSMAKRYGEINRAYRSGQRGKLRGRGYRTDDGPFVLSVGLASAVAAVVVLLQYVANDASPADVYRSPEWLWPVSFLVFMWTTRIWLKAHRNQLDDDPVIFALKDPPSWLLGSLVAVCFTLALI